MLNKLWFLFENHPKLMPKLLQKWNKNVEQIGTHDFSIFSKSTTLKSFFATIKGTEIDDEIDKKRNEISDRKKGAEMLPKRPENGSKWDPKSAGNLPKTIP